MVLSFCIQFFVFVSRSILRLDYFCFCNITIPECNTCLPLKTSSDIRGNNLDAAFGWRLIKAMKRKYLQLDFCNGVDLRGIRENKTRRLILSDFKNHGGMYGMEVVGAIFLAHFLRFNESVVELSFRRNDVQKDGAKVSFT